MKMMTFEVWHFSTPELLSEGYLHPDRVIVRWLNNHEKYRKVAEVEASDLDTVWGITQNKDDSWTKRPEIKWSKSHEIRSTSVGDVLVQNGKAWLVAWEGFLEMNKEKPPKEVLEYQPAPSNASEAEHPQESVANTKN